MADGDVSLRFRLLGQDAGASQAFDKVGRSSEHLSGKMVAVGAAIGSLAASGIIALGGMAAGAVKTGLTTAAAMQQAQLGFATLLGSEQAAGSYMKWLTNFAASTPFEMQGLVESSRTLIGVGVSAQQAKSMLQDFGDGASAIGIQQDAFQRIMLATSQAISAGKFQAGDLNQIMTNGLPVWSILSKAMHKSVPELRDLASHGKLLAKDVLPALQSEMHKDYGGAMAKQSQTLNGLWSTFQDTVSLGLGKVLQPLVPMLQKVLPGAMETLGKWFDKTAGAAQGFIDGITGGSGKGLTGVAAQFHDIGTKAKDAFDKVKQGIDNARPVIEGLLGSIQQHATVFQTMAVSVAAAITAYKVWTAITTALMIAQGLLDAAMDANPIMLIVIAVAALVAGLIYAYQHSETFRDIVNGAFNAVKGVVVAVADAIKGAWDAVAGFLSGVWAQITSSAGSLTSLWGPIVSAWNGAIGAIKAIPDAVVGFFAALPGEILAAVAALPGLLVEFLKTGLENAAFAVGFGLGMMVNLFIIWPFKVGEALASLPGIVWHWITTTGLQGAQAVGSFLGNWLSQIGNWFAAVGAWFAKLPGEIVHWITTTGVQSVVAFYQFHIMLLAKATELSAALVAWVSALVPKVVGWFERLPGMAVDAVKALPGLIKAVFSSAGTWLLDAGKQVVMGLVNGIKNAAGAAMSAVKDLAGNVLGGFKSALSINSPSKVMADQVGVSIPEGIALGMNDGAHHIATAAARLVPTTPGAYGVGASTGRGGGGGDTHVHIHMPTGFVGSTRELAVAMSDVLQRAKAQGVPINA